MKSKQSKSRDNPGQYRSSQHWSHDDGRLPEGRLVRPLPPPVSAGHGLDIRARTRERRSERANWPLLTRPTYRARLGRRLELAARSSPEILLCGASFGHELERALVRGKLVGCGAIQRAVRRLLRRAVTRKITTLCATRVRHPPFGHHAPRFRHLPIHYSPSRASDPRLKSAALEAQILNSLKRVPNILKRVPISSKMSKASKSCMTQI